MQAGIVVTRYHITNLMNEIRSNSYDGLSLGVYLSYFLSSPILTGLHALSYETITEQSIRAHISTTRCGEQLENVRASTTGC